MGEMQFHAYQHLSGRWRWRLMARDGATIATSGESFDSSAAAIAAAEAVKHGATRAAISPEPVGSMREVLRELAHRSAHPRAA